MIGLLVAALGFALCGFRATSALLSGFALGLCVHQPSRHPRTAAALLVVLLLLQAFPAHAAVWQRVSFLWPDSSAHAVRVVGRRWLAPGPWAPATLWAGPGAQYGALSRTRGPGALDTAWVSTSQDPTVWRRGGQALRMAYVTALGDTLGWGNLQLVAAGVPADTLMFDACGSQWDCRPGGPCGPYQRSTRNALAPTIWEVSWVRAPEDTILVAPPLWPELNGRGPIVHMEDLQVAIRCRFCPIYHYVARRGVRDSSLCVAPCP